MMALFTLSLLLSWTLDVSYGQQSTYCSISRSHTLCQYQGISPSCGTPFAQGFGESHRNQIVSLHNKLRSRVATGQERRGTSGSQPPASNMQELEWDNELAAVAQRWAEQCAFGHDTNRDVGRFKVGQNVYQTTRSRDQPLEDMIQAGIMGWYDEVKDFSGREVTNYRFNSGTGHYTQMVWATTNKVGCGQVTYRRSGFVNKYLVCNYGPSGNFLGSQMYSPGKACSKCSSSCSRTNPGLCSSGEGGNVSGLVGGHDAVPDTFFPVNDRPSSFGSPSRPSSFTPTTVELVTSSNPLAFGPPVTGPPMGDESFPDLPSNEIVPRPTRIPPRRRRPFFSFFQRPLQFMGFRPMRFNRFFT